MELLALACAGAVAVLTGLVVALAVVRAGRQRRRRDRLARWAARHGWALRQSPGVDWASRLPGGNRRGLSLTLSGTVDGWPVTVGEYAYTETHLSSVSDGTGGITTGTTSHTHHFVVVVVGLGQPYPSTAVQPRGPVSRLGQWLAGGPAAVPAGEARFDRRFRIHAAEPAAARRLVGPALLAEHLAGTVPSWRLDGTELLTYWPGRLAEPERIPALVAPLLRVATLLGR